ncbi:uncharacterized protein LY89DRAFT_102015 [Mollisia scopiformis]|uniref:Uncharacterized protein n=1 Tax=Mollisia scopiformis TaxID=149040 RepID=A0A194X7H9_MOLSC|nr:uncharacterized protein LY89DRAFT_102015 [Mollisia scopiformis]KUJ16054.1 hypothetical protein LY89DRAFT_102015 [Mollisia scopiformis]
MASSVRILTVLTILSLLRTINALNYFPAAWTVIWNVPLRVSNKWGNKGTSLLTAGLGVWTHIYDIIKNCKQQDGTPVDGLDCAHSVIVSLFSCGLAAMSYETIAAWTKRDTINADTILDRIPNYIKITDMKVFWEPIIANTSSPSHRRRELHAREAPIDVYYNGSMPFVHLYHASQLVGRHHNLSNIFRNRWPQCRNWWHFPDRWQ